MTDLLCLDTARRGDVAYWREYAQNSTSEPLSHDTLQQCFEEAVRNNHCALIRDVFLSDEFKSQFASVDVQRALETCLNLDSYASNNDRLALVSMIDALIASGRAHASPSLLEQFIHHAGAKDSWPLSALFKSVTDWRIQFSEIVERLYRAVREGDEAVVTKLCVAYDRVYTRYDMTVHASIPVRDAFRQGVLSEGSRVTLNMLLMLDATWRKLILPAGDGESRRSRTHGCPSPGMVRRLLDEAFAKSDDFSVVQSILLIHAICDGDGDGDGLFNANLSTSGIEEYDDMSSGRDSIGPLEYAVWRNSFVGLSKLLELWSKYSRSSMLHRKDTDILCAARIAVKLGRADLLNLINPHLETLSARRLPLYFLVEATIESDAKDQMAVLEALLSSAELIDWVRDKDFNWVDGFVSIAIRRGDLLLATYLFQKLGTDRLKRLVLTTNNIPVENAKRAMACAVATHKLEVVHALHRFGKIPLPVGKEILADSWAYPPVWHARAFVANSGLSRSRNNRMALGCVVAILGVYRALN